jgi:ATP-dependent Clp protease ATP-binding subunit ClpX
MFKLDNVNIKFSDGFVEEVATMTVKSKTGARGIKTIFEKVLTPIKFNIKSYSNKNITITRDIFSHGDFIIEDHLVNEEGVES